MKKKLRGSIFLLLATIIWGSAFVSQSVAMDHIGPFSFQAIRSIIAVLGLMPVIWLLDKRKDKGASFVQKWTDKKLWKAGILCGIPLFLACNLQQVGLVDTDAGKSGFLTAMYIVIVPIFGLFLRKKASIMMPISVVIAVAGLYCLSFSGATSIQVGDLLTIGCAFMFAIQITLVDRYAPDLDALRLNAVQSLVCSVLSFVVALFTETITVSAVTACTIPLLHAGLLSMGAAYSLQILGQQDIEPTGASLIMSLESVFAVLFGMLILHETMLPREIFGCVLMFIAVILSQIPIKKKVHT